jgi:hypothetical protein
MNSFIIEGADERTLTQNGTFLAEHGGGGLLAMRSNAPSGVTLGVTLKL